MRGTLLEEILIRNAWYKTPYFLALNLFRLSVKCFSNSSTLNFMVNASNSLGFISKKKALLTQSFFICYRLASHAPAAYSATMQQWSWAQHHRAQE